jgi:hypothetical protein
MHTRTYVHTYRYAVHTSQEKRDKITPAMAATVVTPPAKEVRINVTPEEVSEGWVGTGRGDRDSEACPGTNE